MSETEIESDPTSGAANSPRSEQVDSASPSSRCSLDCDCSFDFEASWDKIQELPDSIYNHYCENNLYPPVQEEKIIKSNIVEALAQISLITAKMDRSEAHSLQRLPLELLARVFWFSANAPGVFSQGFRGQQPPTSLNPSNKPWVLSQVCQSWRKTVLNTPDLSTNVSFTIPSDVAGGQTIDVSLAQCHRLQLQLQRSANHPINVYTKTPDATTTSLERFLSPLCAYSPSWRHLRIELDGDIFRPWMSCISGRLQSLESLEVKFLGPYLSVDFEAFQFAPQLRSVTFSAGPQNHLETWRPYQKFKLPFEQVTHFRWQDNIDGLGAPADYMRLVRFIIRSLRHFQAAKSCRIDLHANTIAHLLAIQARPEFVQGKMFTSLKHLTELELFGIESQTGMVAAVLPYLKLPFLGKLTIPSSGPDHRALSEFLTQPHRLVFLSIQRVEMPLDEFSTVLAPLILLNDLSLGVAQVGGISDNYLSLFNQKNSTGSRFSLIPKLESLSLLPVGDFASTYTIDALINVLEARWRVLLEPADDSSNNAETLADSRLMSVKLDKGIDDERLDQLRVEGLRVVLWGDD
ncbi:hypothetical protein AAF712_015271 [Marasmius tenuissimus]|uniref:F-box domain-containing protein n=1 Tax=Marasmius tenuissimus TaxID=585030 RepID=A0ABR2Z8Q1_9AGAR